MSTESDADQADVDASAGDEDKSVVLDAEAVAQLARDEKRATKTLRFETPEGNADYEYGMVREATLAALSDEHFATPEVRGRGQADELNVDEDDFERFRAAVIKAGLVAGPDGTKMTVQWIRKNIPDQWQGDLFDAITDFSTMDDEEFVKFR